MIAGFSPNKLALDAVWAHGEGDETDGSTVQAPKVNHRLFMSSIFSDY